MSSDLRPKLIDLARKIEIERRELRDAINLPTLGKPDDERAKVSEWIRDRGRLRHQRADDILQHAEQAPQQVRELLYSAARQCRAGNDEATLLLERAAAQWQVEAPAATHSPDFRSVHWFGTTYSFTPNQAACVEVLWKAWESGSPDVGGATLLQAADAVTERMSVLFRGNAAWGRLIAKGGTNGAYRLAAPI